MTNDSLRDYLVKKLDGERATMTEMEGLYLGTSPLAFIDPATLRALDNRVKPLPINLCRLAVDVLAQRCQVAGFRSSPGDVVDNMLVALWKSLGLPASSALAQLDALVYGRSYFLAWAGSRGEPIVTAESPLQFTVTRDPITREVVGALKRWRDPDGYTRSMVITADTVTEYASRHAAPTDEFMRAALPLAGEDNVLAGQEPNALGRVPVVALVNRPRLAAPDGESDLSDLSAPVKAISKLASDLMVSSEYASIPRRWMTVSASMSPEQAQEAQEALARSAASPNASRFTVVGGSGNEQARVGTFDTAELSNFRAAIELLVDQVAALASLPPYYVRGGTANPQSADAIRSSEARLTAKARQRAAWWGPAYADLMRLAVTIRDGYEDPRLTDLETLWVDPEPATDAQTADAVSKTYGANIIDRRTALTELGLSPLEIERNLSTPTEIGAIA
ncbi:MAG: phage portal protein [Actinomycetota bacterium]|nr:phage portal protein [Actinomycetota bacterium]